MNEETRTAALVLGYIAAGTGFLGGWPYWNTPVKVLYVLTFPLHAVFASLVRDLWPQQEESRAIVFAIVIFIFLICLGG